MQYLINVFKFGWPYLRPFWQRAAIGVLLGFVFAASSASFIWAAQTVIHRMEKPDTQKVLLAKATAEQAELLAEAEEEPAEGVMLALDNFKKSLEVYQVKIEKTINDTVDPWLPINGRVLDWRQILGGLLFLPVLVAARGFTGYASSYCLAWVSERAINNLRIEVMKKLTSLSLDYFNKSTMGDMIARVNNDTAMLYRTLSLGFSDLVKEPATVLIAFSFLVIMDWKLTLIAFVFLPICVVPLLILGKKVFKASQGSIKAQINMTSLMVEMLSSIRVVKAYNLEEPQVGRFNHLCNESVHHGIKGAKARELVNPITETIGMIGVGLLLTFIFKENIEVHKLIGFLTGIIVILQPLKKLARLHNLFKQTSVGVNRIMELFAEEPTVKEPENPVKQNDFHGAIEFRDLTFAYTADQPVLKNLNLSIPKGLKLGIAGESGSGKSTLVNLIFRFYDPTEGEVLIDDVNIRNFDSQDLRHHMALVSQESVIFDQTVAENIACGRPGATREEVEAAAKAAYAHDFIINQLSNGYETSVGERGVTLSGGQKQRIAIARAFIRNAPILVLDEATASLDSQAEAEVQKAIDHLSEHRTVICIAHRLSTLKKMDKVLVIRAGETVEMDTFNNLLQKGGLFTELAARQGISAE